MSNNAWLQEMPKPQNKMTWDNAVWISPRSAERYGVTTGDVVELDLHGRKVDGPVWIMPGQVDETLTVHFGYGRTRAGKVADGVGFSAYVLRTTNSLWRDTGATITRKRRGYEFATTQHTQTMEERDPFRAATYAAYRKEPEFARPEEKRVPPDLTMFPQWGYKQHKWGMSIDLNSCMGCQACTVACQAENNIPVVGKEEVAKGRHMNWLRVDRYFKGPLEDPELYFQPVPCMHCENALCELVCPVAATVHSAEGLNEMVYNRCVGTRYCSNNCPYKVRRFNFSCTRIGPPESFWSPEPRRHRPQPRRHGEMQLLCPAHQWGQNRRGKAGPSGQGRGDRYRMPAGLPGGSDCLRRPERSRQQSGAAEASTARLPAAGGMNTKPRTTYLARLRNPNPDLEKG